MSISDKFYQNPDASDYVVNFYLKNRLFLLDAPMCRSNNSIAIRKNLYKQIVDDCRNMFGIVSDQNKVKYHFDNRKGKVTRKGHDWQQKQRQSGQKTDDCSTIFENETDQKLWGYIIASKDNQEENVSFTERFQEACKEATASMQLVKEEEPEEPQENFLESLLRNNGVVLDEKKKTTPLTLNKDMLKWDNFTQKLVLPPDASDYVLEFFLDNQAILLENTNSRSNLNNLERKQKMNELVTHIQQRYGIVTDAHKMKSHFDNRKQRIMRKGFDYKSIISRGNGTTTVEEMFEFELEARLYKHFADTQVKEKAQLPEFTTEFCKEIKVEAPEIIEGQPLNLSTLLPTEAEPQTSTRSESPEVLKRAPKRRAVNEEEKSHHQNIRPISDEEFRAKQYELMEKQIKFFDENAKLLTAMTSAVSILFSKIEALNVPRL